MRTIKELMIASGGIENADGSVTTTGGADRIELTVHATMTGWETSIYEADKVRFWIGNREVWLSIYDVLDAKEHAEAP